MSTDHLLSLPPVQCVGCLRDQVWEGEGKVGDYRLFLVETHADDCPYKDRDGVKVFHEELK